LTKLDIILETKKLLISKVVSIINKIYIVRHQFKNYLLTIEITLDINHFVSL